MTNTIKIELDQHWQQFVVLRCGVLSRELLGATHLARAAARVPVVFWICIDFMRI
jgi:hypothetical protein